MSKVSEIIQKLRSIAEEGFKENNQGVSPLMFVVYEKHWIYNMDPKRGNAVRYWKRCYQGEVKPDDDDLHEALEMLEEKHGRGKYDIGEHTYTAAYKFAEYVPVDGAAFFTREGAERYIERHKHDLSGPYVAVEAAQDNPEWKLVCELLTALVEESRPVEPVKLNSDRDWALKTLREYFTRNLAEDPQDGTTFDIAVLDALSNESIFEGRYSDAPRPELQQSRQDRLKDLRDHYNLALLESGEEDIQTGFDVAVLDALSDKNIFGGTE